MENKEILKYKIGALLYCPANKEDIAENILHKKWDLNTIVFDLEDAILPQFTYSATIKLEDTISKLFNKKDEMELPLIFIRVRTSSHLEEIYSRFCKYKEIITGFVLPKFDMSVATNYLRVIRKININNDFYFLPILETPNIMTFDRRKELYKIKRVLQDEKSILGILTGGNDMCSYFGIRRNSKQTIYDIGVIRDILVDIINIFSKDFVVSAPIWEYFDGENWEKGLRKELELDRLNGFIGKACIHPYQIPIVKDCLKVDKYEYEEALDLVNWKENNGVKKNSNTGRMNEIATNKSWGEITKILGDIYGTK